MAVIYRHTRLDNNEVFYIGIGVSNKRPYEKSNRNKFWLNITNKTEYNVEVLKNDLSYDDAKELEVILIDYYGRYDLGLGTLVNMTNGGEGSPGVIPSKEKRDNQREKMLGNNNPFFNKKHNSETKNRISNSKKGNSPAPNKKLVVNLETGIFYDSITEASKTTIYRKEALTSMLNGSRKNLTSFITI
jgi:hypothetical protein